MGLLVSQSVCMCVSHTFPLPCKTFQEKTYFFLLCDIRRTSLALRVYYSGNILNVIPLTI